MKKILVHEFHLSDNDDPEIYAAGPIYDWQQTEAGQWVMSHSQPEPHWNMDIDHNIYGYRVRIIANLSEEDITFFQLKYGYPSHRCI